MEGGRGSSKGVSFCCCGCPRGRGRTKVRDREYTEGRARESRWGQGERGHCEVLAKDTLGYKGAGCSGDDEIFRGNFVTVSPPLWGVLARPHSADCCLLLPKEFAGAPLLEHCPRLITSPIFHSPRLARGRIKRRESLGNTGRKRSPSSQLANRQELLACPHGTGLQSQVNAEARVSQGQAQLGLLS